MLINFGLFSVTVSAKEGDGSIHAAIQTLVRHLLLKKMKLKNKNVVLKNLFNENKKAEGTDDDETAFVPFLKTGINEVCFLSQSAIKPVFHLVIFSHRRAKTDWVVMSSVFVTNQSSCFFLSSFHKQSLLHAYLTLSMKSSFQLDEIFKQCEQPMQMVEECSSEYTKAVNMFRKSCCVIDLTPSTRSSIEECITGLKEVITSDEGKCGLKVCKLLFYLIICMQNGSMKFKQT
jgi:hypothetical protein